MPESIPRTTVIVGTGVAGASAALTLRHEGFDGRIQLIGDESHIPYRRPLLSKELLKRPVSNERVQFKPESFWQEQGIELHTHTKVKEIRDRRLLLADGNFLTFDRLLLATGGQARTLPHVIRDERVHTLRTLDDLTYLRSDLMEGGSLLVIGAGLVGLEVAATARTMGLDVTVLEAAAEPLRRTLPRQLRQAIVQLHGSHGVEIHTGVHLANMGRHGKLLYASSSDGRTWKAHTVLVAAGVQPRAELAIKAGLKTDDGIIVDEYGATSHPNIYAAGDVARLPDRILNQQVRVEQWNHAQEHATHVARNMLGARTPFTAVPWGWTEQYGIRLQLAGHPALADNLRVHGEVTDFDFTALAHRYCRPIGAVVAGRPAEFQTMRAQIGRQAEIRTAICGSP
ncbi:FAD-dependent oxidoreductase [Streptomyces sp. NPDC051133]|uniref:NAD(P)/FAD-dependent oxidoreductase n=1 Tax=Streptomyces sp. NPDC051133 TaxID=3155521 RepID=UPI00341ABB3D